MPAETRAEVLVAGAGPVGLTAAHELARRGLRVRLVDAAGGPARTSRAVAVHPRTLETFDQMGMVEAVLRQGRANRAFTMFASGRRLVRLEADYASMPTRYPYTVVVEQTATEHALREAVAALGVTPEWGTRVTGFDQDADTVRVRLTRADGSEEICTADWLVGCDGGHSTVRKQLGLPLLGESRDTWMLADAPVRTALPPDSIYWVHTGTQALMMVPYAREGHWRLLDTAPGDRTAQQAPERFSRKLSAGLGTAVTVGEPEWTSVFTFQQRMVPRMHEGRVFVAGDAAHVHSPASGQGMNTGIQEAYNLAWKLADVARGHAGRHLLRSYDAERVPIGRALLGSTRTATFLVQFKNLMAAAALPVVFTVVRNVPPLRRAIQRKVLGGMSGLRIGYRDSPLARPADAAPGARRRPARGPAPGDRVSAAAARRPGAPGPDALAGELRDVRWTLLHAACARHRDGAPDAVSAQHRDGTSDAVSARHRDGAPDAVSAQHRDGTSDAVSARHRDGAPDAVSAQHRDGTSDAVSARHRDGTPDAVSARAAADAAGRHGAWLSVRTLDGRPGTDPGPLPDPDGALRDALGMPEGGWLLIRPDGYLAARGHRLTDAALARTLTALGLGTRTADGPALFEEPSCTPPAVSDTVLSTSAAGEADR